MIKSFQLAGKKYRVKHGTTDTDCVGMCNVSLCEIVIRDMFDGKKIPEDSKEQTLYHEVVHAIFQEIGRDDLYKDETLVQSFSLLLHQFAKTAK